MIKQFPLGAPVPGWTPPPVPPREGMTGRYCRLEILALDHAADLFAHFQGADDLWTYMPQGPFESEAALKDWLVENALGDAPLFHAIIDQADGRAKGVASYLRIAPEAGSIEVGYLTFAPAMQGTRIGTEAMYLMMARAFALGYRRYEWKCNALNAASRRLAGRLGFSFEGIFRQAGIVKGCNRDTAWFAAIDSEWPALQAAFKAWLSPDNFEADGQQKIRLSALTRPILVKEDL